MVIPDKLAEYFGFTEDEVKSLCTRFNRDFDEIKAWYDGYLMPGNIHLYNPRSVVKAMDGGKLQGYWVATSSFEALNSESLQKYSGDILLVGITYDDDKKHYCKIEKLTKP